MASAESYITNDDSPFLIEHVIKDQLVLTQQTVMFYEKLVKVLGKEKVTLHLLEKVQNSGKEFEKPENLQTVFSFFDKTLK